MHLYIPHLLGNYGNGALVMMPLTHHGKGKELIVMQMGIVEKLLERFNSYFRDTAKATIRGSVLEITIGSQTLRISMPEVTGGESTGPS